MIRAHTLALARDRDASGLLWLVVDWIINQEDGGLLRAGPAAGGSGFAVSAFLPYAAAPGVDPDHVHA